MHNDLEVCLLSVMGPHAGEESSVIFARKIKDIERVGRTYWLTRATTSRPPVVQALCAACGDGKSVECLFISAAGGAEGSPTSTAAVATQYSLDRLNWLPLHSGLSQVTGRLDKGSYALVFDQLRVVQPQRIDLWDFGCAADPTHPVVPRQGASTLCAVKQPVRDHLKLVKSRYRNLIAVGRLAEPYAVWLR